ncbi:MAG: hypothetical protein ACRDU8_02805, partial [Egibacteraceae bacterium]
MATSTRPRNRNRPPQLVRKRSAVRVGAVVVGAVVLLAVVTLVGLRAARSGVLPGVLVVGRDVGGTSEEELRAILTDVAEDRGKTRIVAVRGDERLAGRAARLGYAFDVDATAAAVMERGRQSSLPAALSDHVRAFRGTIEVEPIQSVDPQPLQAWARRAAKRLAREPREGRLRFTDDGEVQRINPRAGAVVQVAPLVSTATQRTLSATTGEIEVATRATRPDTTRADVDAVLAVARRAVSGPVTLRRSDSSATLSPADLAGTLRTVVVGEGDGAEIELRIDPEKVTAAIGPGAIAAFEQEAQEARVELGGDGPRVVEGRTGFAYDEGNTAEQVLALATGKGNRCATLHGRVTEPELSTAEARDLQIVEQVSSFTTNHACCESRVVNIHRIADILEGVVVTP